MGELVGAIHHSPVISHKTAIIVICGKFLSCSLKLPCIVALNYPREGELVKWSRRELPVNHCPPESENGKSRRTLSLI